MRQFSLPYDAYGIRQMFSIELYLLACKTFGPPERSGRPTRGFSWPGVLELQERRHEDRWVVRGPVGELWLTMNLPDEVLLLAERTDP